MDAYLRRVNKEVTGYDKRLYAVRANGMVQIWRQGYSLKDQMIPIELEDHKGRPNPQFILALTIDWTLSGKPVEWGLEALMTKIRSMDSWRHGDEKSQHQERIEARNRIEQDQDRQKKNELRAVALDLRKDFAKATNDINTSSLAKVDRRREREKNGNCK